MDKDAVLVSLAADWELIVSNETSLSMQLLEDRINYLLNHDFDKLISLLYRMDVSERKLRMELEQHPQKDAARIIAMLVIEREWQKIQSRKQFPGKKNDVTDEEEKW